MKTTMGRIALVALVAACNTTKEIDDPQMTQAGVNLGASSTALAEMPDDADEATVQSNTSAVGGNIQSLASLHQSYSASNGAATSAPAIDAASLAQDADSTFEWDGSRLVVSWSTDIQGSTYDYDLDLTFDRDGDNATINGTYNVDFGLDVAGITSDYEVDARYNAVRIEDGCTVGGSVEIDYDYSTSLGVPGLPGGNSASSGRIVVTYNACDDVTISGT